MQATNDIISMNVVEEICEAIKNGEKVEKYEEWRHASHMKIRQALAKAGYWPEQFVDDKEPMVRVAVLNKHPQYVHILLKQPFTDSYVVGVTCKQETPNLEILKALREHYKKEIENYEPNSLDLKIKALETQPTALTLSMTTQQLFESGSPIWAKSLPLQTINYLLSAVKQAQNQGLEKELVSHFNQLFEGEHFYLKIHKVSREIGLTISSTTVDTKPIIKRFL